MVNQVSLGGQTCVVSQDFSVVLDLDNSPVCTVWPGDACAVPDSSAQTPGYCVVDCSVKFLLLEKIMV